MGNYDGLESAEGRGVRESTEISYKKVQRLIDGDRTKEAIGALEMFLEIYPGYGVAHNDLGVLYFKQGLKEKAIQCYEQAAQLDPYNDVFQKNLADFYYVEAGRMGEALQIYVKLLDANPTDIEILLILGQICVSLKKTDDAKLFLNKVLELEPWNMDARERLDSLGRGIDDSLIGGFDNSLIGKFDDSGRDGGQRSGVRDQWSGGKGIESAEEMYQDAQGLVKSGRDKEGISALERLLKAYPDFGFAHNDLGVLYYNQGLKEKALEHYERAARVEPYNDVFQKNLADFYYVEAGRMGEALQIYVKLLDANPTDIETLLVLGQICASLKKVDDAREFFNKVLELEPWNVDARERLDELGREIDDSLIGGLDDSLIGKFDDSGRDGGWRTEVGGQVSGVWEEKAARGADFVDTPDKMYQDVQELLSSNRKKDAVNALEKLVASYPDYALAHNDLGVLYFSEGDKEKSLQYYQKAAVLEPQNSVFQKNLADFYYAILGRTEAALEIYLKILEANPTDTETLLIMGHICVSMRKFDDAKVFYNRALEIEPWNVDAREKLDQLGKRTDDLLIGKFDDLGRDKGQGLEVGGQRTEDGGRRTEDSGLWPVVGGQGGGLDEGIETDLGAHVVNEEFQSDSKRFILSLILSSENAERLIRATGEEEESSGISDQIDIVVGDKASRQDGRGAIREIQAQSKNIIYVETGESYPQDAVDALKFVAKRVNDSRNAPDIKRELAELSSSTGIPTLDPDKADLFISLFERLSDALKELTEPFRASPVAPEELVAGEKVEAKKGQDASDDAHKENILSRIVKMKNEKGLGWKDISEVFNSEGLPTFSGKGKWHRKTIYKMYQKTIK